VKRPLSVVLVGECRCRRCAESSADSWLNKHWSSSNWASVFPASAIYRALSSCQRRSSGSALLSEINGVVARRYYTRHILPASYTFCTNDTGNVIRAWTDQDAVWVADSSRPKEAAHITWDAHWRHLANTTEPLMCGGDAAFLTLTTC